MVKLQLIIMISDSVHLHVRVACATTTTKKLPDFSSIQVSVDFPVVWGVPYQEWHLVGSYTYEPEHVQI